MSRVVTSKTSTNNAHSVASRDLLGSGQQGNPCLNTDPDRGIAAYARWQRALDDAGRRWEALNLLISKAWRAFRELMIVPQLTGQIWTLGVLLPFALCFAYPPASAYGRGSDQLGIPGATKLSAVRVAGPFEYPWSFAFLPNGTILLTERPGRLQLISAGSSAREVSGLPNILAKDLGGLLDVAIDPGFSENGIVYLSYVHGTTEASTVRVLRATLDVDRVALRDQQVIFESTPATAIVDQLGGRMVVTGDGQLYLTLGVRWNPVTAQDLASHAGKIVRIRSDGAVPTDNPFVLVPGARPETWSYGHRNPQGLAYDGRTGRLWSHEHGSLGGDELNLIIGGRNYGWPVITHSRDYSGNQMGVGPARAGMEQPVHHWTPAIAPSGLAVENAGAGTVLWVGALAGQSVIRLEIDVDGVVREQRLLTEELGRVRDVRIGLGGHIHVITDSPKGWLYKLQTAVEPSEMRVD